MQSDLRGGAEKGESSVSGRPIPVAALPPGLGTAPATREGALRAGRHSAPVGRSADGDIGGYLEKRFASVASVHRAFAEGQRSCL
jgi:hypothetical protein